MSLKLRELTESLRNNKLRTFLTGFTVAWGIIILVLMLGAGKGVENGIRDMVAKFGGTQVSLKYNIYSTDIAYAGFQEGRDLYLTPEQLKYLQETNEFQVRSIEPSLTGVRFRELTSIAGSAYLNFEMLTSRQQDYNLVELERGRMFSKTEHEMGARVVLLGSSGVSKLFEQGTDPIGQMVRIEGVSFEVVGVIKSSSPFFSSYTIPYNTYMTLYPNERFKIKSFVVYPRENGTAALGKVEESIKAQIYNMLRIDPDDNGAMWIQGSVDFGKTMEQIFIMLQLLLWVMGIGSLSIGTIGVSNIMYVTIQERMREIGIRKALGAKPRHIMTMVLGESLLLSVGSGLIGLGIGFLLIQILDYVSAANNWGSSSFPTGFGEEMTYSFFSNPEMSFSVAFGALVVLVVAGLIAGYGPAKKAIKIPAIEAMRDTK
ncbi:MAG: ABC transporter permease [Porphyromonas sp.]|nr:ABC transporter permease [Porphyromonas sp.]